MFNLLFSVAALPEHRGLLILGAALIGSALVLRRLISTLRKTVAAKVNAAANANRITSISVRPPEAI
jgi:hypothetical protein